MSLLLECIKNFFKKPFTQRYPKEKIKPEEHFRGKLKYIPEKCIGCKQCAINCPSDCITFHETGKIDFDQGACLYCGLCVDVCPTKAIIFTQEFDYASNDKKDFVVK